MRFGSVCSGIEAASVAWHPLGWQAAWFAEIEPFPCAVLAHHYPTVPNLGDMTTIAKRVMTGEVEAPDVLAGGTPCFTSGHLVLTASGYAPIETIKPGDMVVTHLGRLRRVVRIGSKQASVGTLKAVGLREPLTVTGDHPFLAVEWHNQSTKREGRYARIEHCGGLEWIEAKIMPGRQWCALTTYESGESFFRSAKLSEQEAMYVAGMYLGDGHIRRWGDAAKKALVLSLNEAKLSKLKRAIGDAGFSVSHDRSVARVTICDTALCEWLEEQFGKLSHLKRIPSWVLGHKNRSLLLQGYLDTDGTKMVNGVGISTVSRALAYGAADLMNAEGLVASVGLVETQDTCVIEGRTVNQRDWYQVRGFDRAASQKSRVRRGYLLRTVQSFDEAGIDTVFNIEVEGDNSYVVNGAVVHNCQAFSVAGLRESLADERGNLTLKFVELADAIDFVRVRDGYPPAIVFWENVPGVLSTKDNAFGCFLAGLAGEDEPLRAPGGKWANAGAVYGPARAVAWRTLDAQYFGLAQRRRRVFVVASARDGFDPATVLFEWDGVRRDSAPSRSPGQAAAVGTLGGTSPGGGWRFGADEAAAGQLIPQAFGGNNQSGPIDVATARNACASASGRMDFESETFLVQPIGLNARQDPDCWQDRAGPLDTDGGTQVVAFAENSRAEVRLEGGDGQRCGAISTGGGKPGQGVPMVATTMQVRRLTPTECARLQGFPEIQRIVEVKVWSSGHQKPSASAETKNLKSQRSASSAAENSLQRDVKAVEPSFNTKQDDQERLAVVHVRLRSGILELQIHSAGRSRSSASGAASQRWSPLHMRHDGFARLVALTTTTAANAQLLGEVELQVSASGSTHRQSGRLPFALYGQEIAAFAANAESDTSMESLLSTYTTYQTTRNTQNVDQTLRTLFSYVVTAIDGFIPKEIKAASSYVVRLETSQEYLDILYRGKPAADGPKYKALGNSWAVPVVRWIGERIQQAIDLN